MNNSSAIINTVTIIRARALAKELSINISTLYNWLNPNSPYYKPDFPKKIDLGGRYKGWYLSQIKQWLDNNQTG